MVKIKQYTLDPVKIEELILNTPGFNPIIKEGNNVIMINNSLVPCSVKISDRELLTHELLLNENDEVDLSTRSCFTYISLETGAKELYI